MNESVSAARDYLAGRCELNDLIMRNDAHIEADARLGRADDRALAIEALVCETVYAYITEARLRELLAEAVK